MKPRLVHSIRDEIGGRQEDVHNAGIVSPARFLAQTLVQLKSMLAPQVGRRLYADQIESYRHFLSDIWYVLQNLGIRDVLFAPLAHFHQSLVLSRLILSLKYH